MTCGVRMTGHSQVSLTVNVINNYHVLFYTSSAFLFGCLPSMIIIIVGLDVVSMT